MVEEMGLHLKEECPELFCEIGKLKEDPYATLVITVDGRQENITLAQDVVKCAPDLPRWKVIAFRQRGNMESLEIRMGDEISLGIKDLHCQAFVGPHGELGVTLLLKDMDDQENDKRAGAAVLLMDHAIGEYDAMTAIRSLSIEPYKEDLPGLMPLEDLPGFIDKMKNAGIDRWDCYMTTLDEEGSAASIFVKMGLGAWAPQLERSQRLRVIVPITKPREDGLIDDQDEVEQLWAIEEELVETLEESSDALFVGRVTTGGIRDFVFYYPEGERPEFTVQKFFGHYPQYEADINLSEDPEWEFFQDILMPDEYESLAMSIDHKVRALDEADDPLEQPRPVSILLSFEEEEARASFIEKLADDITHKLTEPNDEDPRYFIELEKTTDATPKNLGDYCLLMFKEVKDLGGDFEGWSCPAISSGEEADEDAN
ncbi:MAG: DUF695 domain-containing protein [Planctomycetota bacterium]|nr:DUF695 domain-containing protein [Planctomycetota bacterium]